MENLTKRFGAQTLFEGAGFSLGLQERIGIVGPNGAGKSTFFRILTGAEDVDGGAFHVPNNYRILLMEQEWTPLDGDSVIEASLRVFEPWFLAKKELDQLATDLEKDESLLSVYQEKETHFLTLGGYQVEYEIKEILSGLGFKAEQFEDPVMDLSGGWRMRCYLGGLLVQKADLLLLDEPTNHLDMDSVVWFENFLKNYEHSLMVISHDRRLIENISKKILEFAPPKLTLWPGGLKKFESSKEVRMEQLTKEITQKTREMEKLKDFARRFGAKATKARQAQNKLRNAHQFEEDIAKLQASMPLDATRVSRFKLVLDKRQPKVCMEMEGAQFGYDQGAPLFDIDKSLVESGKKIGVIGDNGVGKTTFLKTIAGEIDHVGGNFKVHDACNVSFFTQHRMEELPMHVKALDYLVKESNNETISQIRGVAASLGLNQLDMDKNLEVMSGGEKARVSLARILLQKPDILLLDEPTNHLDMEACDALVEGLKSYTGTVMVVSHNRDFLDALVNQIYHLADGKAQMHLGNYSDFAAKQEGIEVPTQSEAKQVTEKKSHRSKEQKRLDAEARKAKSGEKKKVTQALEELEAEMDAMKDESKELDKFLMDPSKAGSKLFTQNLKRRGRLIDKLEIAEEKWLTLQEQLEAFK